MQSHRNLMQSPAGYFWHHFSCERNLGWRFYWDCVFSPEFPHLYIAHKFRNCLRKIFKFRSTWNVCVWDAIEWIGPQGQCQTETYARNVSLVINHFGWIELIFFFFFCENLFRFTYRWERTVNLWIFVPICSMNPHPFWLVRKLVLATWLNENFPFGFLHDSIFWVYSDSQCTRDAEFKHWSNWIEFNLIKSASTMKFTKILRNNLFADFRSVS